MNAITINNNSSHVIIVVIVVAFNTKTAISAVI